MHTNIVDALKYDVIFSGWGANLITLLLDKLLNCLPSGKLVSCFSNSKEKRLAETLKLMISPFQLSRAVENHVTDMGFREWLNHWKVETHKANLLIDGFFTTSNHVKEIENQIYVVSHLINVYGCLHYGQVIKELELGSEFETNSFIHDEPEIQTYELIKRIEELTAFKKLSIVSVCGFCGVGKSTIARVVFNNVRIKEEYKDRIWVSMRETFNLNLTIKSFMESAGMLSSDANNSYSRFQDYVRDKKLFIVLDGVSHVTSTEIDVFLALLEVCAHGSVVLITSRRSSASTIMHSDWNWELPMLSDLECKAIFEKRAFRMGEISSEYPELLDVGIDIVRNCSGNPLFAKTLGDLLSTKRDLSEWKSMLETDISHLPVGNILYHSLLSVYSSLPLHLRVPLSYATFICGRDCKFEREALIELWIAEDVIQARGSATLEDQANTYFNELVDRFFIQAVNGSTVWFKFYGLAYDMVKAFEMRNLTTSTANSRTTLLGSSEDLHCLLVTFENVQLQDLAMFKNLRLLFFSAEDKFTFSAIPIGLLESNFRRVRVLNISDSELTSLPNSISNMKELKYLDISRTNITSISNICRLSQLQTLRIRGCALLERLPDGLVNLVNLRNLDMDEGGVRLNTPPYIRRLTELQELTTFVIRNIDGCRITELMEMNQLGGSLCVLGVEGALNGYDEEDRYLERKNHLRRLKLAVDDFNIVLGNAFTISHPPQNLKELVIQNYNLEILCDWNWNSLVHLRTVELIGCSNLNSIGKLTELPCLSDLRVGFGGLTILDSSFFGQEGQRRLPMLKRLCFDSWNNLEKWVSVAEIEMPKLKELVIRNCPGLTTIPDLYSLSSLIRLELRLCNSLKFCAGGRPALLSDFMPFQCALLIPGEEMPDEDYWPFWITMDDLPHEDSCQ